MAEYITIKRRVSLDAPIAPESLPGFTYMTEHQAHEFIISVRKNGEKETITGSVSAKVIRPNGTTIFLQGSISDGDAVIRLHQDCYNIPGRLKISIFNTSGGVTTCIYSATYTNDRSTTDNVIDAGDVVPDISDVVAKQEEMTQVIADARTATSAANTAAQNVGNIVARAYSASATYKAGDYCTQNGNLYKANQDISTAEEWTASHWTQIVMGDEVAGVKSALGNNIFQLGALVSDSYVKNDGTFDAYSGWTRTGFVDISKFAEINAKSTLQSLYNCFYSDASESSFISSFPVKMTDNIVAIPDNAKYAVFSGSNAEMNNLSVKVTKTRAEKEIDSVEQRVSTAESNILSRYFILENDQYNSENEDIYFQRLGAIHYIRLLGFEQYEKCRLRLLARNQASFHYRFIIAGYNGSAWSDVFDTGASFSVEENANGDTYVKATVGSKTVEMYIDYSKIPNNFSWNESTPTGNYRYIFSQNVYGKDDEGEVVPDIYFVKNSDTNFDIVYHYSETENMMIKFSPIGVNNLFAPHYLYKRNATKNEPVFSGYTAFDTIGTDWVSPYQGIIENDPSVASGITVGGNHGTNGSSGFPTAQRISIVAYADGKETELNKIYGCKEVKIIVKSNIAASNTINLETGEFDPAMIETIVWTVTKNNFEVCVYLEAIKNISIKGYTGLQMTTGFNPAVYFNDGTGQKSVTGTRIDAVSYPTFSGNRSVIIDTVNGDLRIVYTNRQVGIGDLSHITSGNPVAYVSTNKKLYQHLVNTIPLDLQAGETACYSGGYTLMKSYECVGAKEAYFISYNGEKQYCVDFLESGLCYVKLSQEFIGHQIEVVSKDDTVTVDPVISGNGLRVAATGIGSVCFEIK